jgi:hypothetical protein
MRRGKKNPKTVPFHAISYHFALEKAIKGLQAISSDC